MALKAIKASQNSRWRKMKLIRPHMSCGRLTIFSTIDGKFNRNNSSPSTEQRGANEQRLKTHFGTGSSGRKAPASYRGCRAHHGEPPRPELDLQRHYTSNCSSIPEIELTKHLHRYQGKKPPSQTSRRCHYPLSLCRYHCAVIIVRDSVPGGIANSTYLCGIVATWPFILVQDEQNSLTTLPGRGWQLHQHNV